MIAAELKSPAEAEREIARVFQAEISKGGGQCAISVRDEGAFLENKCLHLGTVCLAVPKRQLSELKDESDLTGPVRLGAFEWSTPAIKTAQSELLEILDFAEKDSPSVFDRVLGNISSIIVRAGMLRPLFDPDALEDMPYKHPTTIVVDTSGVLQGGLDFVVRYLHPAARVKIPAIVHMELVNSAENFFSLRRSHSKKAKSRLNELVEHLKSQGGQRALLRLELQADTEIERTFLLGDPLRDAFQSSKETELSRLNITVPIRSYVDRLIIEAARHHQAQSGPTHEVRLLTSDQGLARMAMAEGIAPLFSTATKAKSFFDACLTGRTFHPFMGKVQSTSLALVFWELATAFGSARLEGKKSKMSFTVSALGKEMSWSPYHSLEDLLWCALTGPSNGDSVATDAIGTVAPQSKPVPPEEKLVSAQSLKASPKITFFRFDTGRLFHLICTLDDSQTLNAEEVVKVLGVKNRRGSIEYRRFLLSAGLISIEGQAWYAKPLLGKLSAALRNERIEEIHDTLLAAPSYAAFAAQIAKLEVGQTLEDSLLGRGTSTYRTLGEITLKCVDVQGEGIYPTPITPNAAEFASLALERYAELEGGDGLVATGAWLEALIRKDGIHPEVARLRLDEASEKGLLRRSTEGSTIQIGHDRHVLHVLRLEADLPSVSTIYLYRGDYLIPGKSSVSLRVEGIGK